MHKLDSVPVQAMRTAPAAGLLLALQLQLQLQLAAPLPPAAAAAAAPVPPSIINAGYIAQRMARADAERAAQQAELDRAADMAAAQRAAARRDIQYAPAVHAAGYYVDRSAGPAGRLVRSAAADARFRPALRRWAGGAGQVFFWFRNPEAPGQGRGGAVRGGAGSSRVQALRACRGCSALWWPCGPPGAAGGAGRRQQDCLVGRGGDKAWQSEAGPCRPFSRSRSTCRK